MPMYSYWCASCDTDKELNVPIASRDGQFCGKCGYRLIRGIDAPGAVWAPTASNGGMKV